MDITMCKGDNCALKEQCLRFKGESGSYQSYFKISPIIDNNCDFYYPIVEDTPLTEKEEYAKFLAIIPNIIKEIK